MGWPAQHPFVELLLEGLRQVAVGVYPDVPILNVIELWGGYQTKDIRVVNDNAIHSTVCTTSYNLRSDNHASSASSL